MNEPPSPPKPASLADYLIRYDLASLLEEARLDYSQSTSGGPRHLDQKDIAARFRKTRTPTRPPTG
ncbi:MAG TPA: hypothetical protein VM029_10925, partial [Opitutaceae bacterium]|nr:hypothetical protein [Opitutaceae bacterium]